MVLSKCRIGLSGGLSGRGTCRWSKGVKVQGGEARHTSEWRGMAGQGGTEGERANARSVTPHCAHLPTHPTPKFELESQPRRFPSTCLPSYPLLSSIHSRSPALFMVNIGRDVSPLVPFVCVFNVHLRPSSFSLAESNKRKKIFAEACVYSCCRYSLCKNQYQCHRWLGLSYSFGNRHHGCTRCCSS